MVQMMAQIMEIHLKKVLIIKTKQEMKIQIKKMIKQFQKNHLDNMEVNQLLLL